QGPREDGRTARRPQTKEAEAVRASERAAGHGAGRDRAADSLEVDGRALARLTDGCGGRRTEEQEDHLVPRDEDRAEVLDRAALAGQFVGARTRAIRGALDLIGRDAGPVALDHVGRIAQRAKASRTRLPPHLWFPHLLS